MKRCIALLMTLAMLCSWAYAETSVVTVSLDEEALSALLMDVLRLTDVDAEEAGLTQWLGPVVQLINSASLRLQTVVSDDLLAERLTLCMDGDEIGWIETVAEPSGDAVVASSLYPGVRIAMKTDPTGLSEALNSLVTGSMMEALDTWLYYSGTIYSEDGLFAGETYSGGTRCKTYLYDDADVANLVDGLVLELEENEAVANLLNLYGVDAAKLWHRIRRMNQEARYENTYSYEIYVVRREGNVIGISANIREYEQTCWTASIGLENMAEEGIPFYLRHMLDDAETYLNGTVQTTDGETRISVDVYAASLGTEDDHLYSLKAVAAQQGLMTKLRTDRWFRLSETLAAQAHTALNVNPAAEAGENLLSFEGGLHLTDDSTTEAGSSAIALNLIRVEDEPFVPAEGVTITVEEANQGDSRLEEALNTGMKRLLVELFRHVPTEMITAPFMQLMQQMSQ